MPTTNIASTSNWNAEFIAPAQAVVGAPVVSASMTLPAGRGAPVAATLALSALGVYEAAVNGQRVGDEVLNPGWTSYEWRIPVRTYDVLPLLAASETTAHVAVTVGNGWYRGKLSWHNRAAVYGTEIAAFAQLDVTFADGTTHTLGTSESWHATGSDILTDDLYDGETIDARRRGGLGASAESPVPVKIIPIPRERLVANTAPPVRVLTEMPPVKQWVTPSGALMLDFGQNLVGWIRIKTEGPRGSTLVVRHAEVLEGNELATRPLRGAAATDRYILSGSLDDFEPTFTFHGFRYASIDGWHGDIPDGAITAVVVGSDLPRIGDFECSDPALNRLHENAVWSTRGNFLSIPTDCPQRDERLGWTGDIAVYAPTASYLFDTRTFLGSWLTDLALEQEHQGVVPFVVPDPLKYMPDAMGFTDAPTTAIWSDAAVWVPWALWRAYDDVQVIDRQLPSMLLHVRCVAELLSDRYLWEGDGFQFGDWLDPAAPPDKPGEARAAHDVVATACAYRTMRMVADMCAAIGRRELCDEFSELADRIRGAFRHHFVDAGGLIKSDAPTVYVLAICFDLLSEAERQTAGDRLAELTKAGDYQVATGFAGTPFVLDALSETGHTDVAYQMLLRRECPSWLYAVTMGATTIWERWDSMLPDGTVNPGQMTSFNHYTFGSVVDWMRRTIGGLAAVEPGYRTVAIAPRPGGGVTHAQTHLDSDFGRISVGWRLDGTTGADDPTARLTIDIELPEGVAGSVTNPFDGSTLPLRPGTHQFVFRAEREVV